MSKKVVKKVEAIEKVEAPIAPVVSHEGTLAKPLPTAKRLPHKESIKNKFCSKTGVGLVTGKDAPKDKKAKKNEDD